AKEGWFEQTAVMWAAAGNDAAIVTALVESGAQVNGRSKGLPGQQPRTPGADTAFQSAHSSFPHGGFTPLLFAAQLNAAAATTAALGNGAAIHLTPHGGTQT